MRNLANLHAGEGRTKGGEETEIEKRSRIVAVDRGEG